MVHFLIAITFAQVAHATYFANVVLSASQVSSTRATAHVTCKDTPTIDKQDGTGFESIEFVATGDCILHFDSQMFNSDAFCSVANLDDPKTTFKIGASSDKQVEVFSFVSGGLAVDSVFIITCTGDTKK